MTELDFLLNSSISTTHQEQDPTHYTVKQECTEDLMQHNSKTEGSGCHSSTSMLITSTSSTAYIPSPAVSSNSNTETGGSLISPESGKYSPEKIKSSPESDKSSSDGTPDKPAASYMTLIAQCILSSPEQRMVLGDIYDYILKNNPFFRDTTCAWRNSVRYTLSVNECFMKDGRAKSGRGYYWAIHPACLGDFIAGDYNRRNARKRVKETNRKFEESIKKARVHMNHMTSCSGNSQSRKNFVTSPPKTGPHRIT
jgi:hypothetical protein